MRSLADALHAGPVVLDGGLATRLEDRGHDLADSLWSARLLVEDPEAIRLAHEDFLAAGAQVLITASYQVSASGFEAAGRTSGEAQVALRRSVELARDACGDAPDRWVAASVGPYGATLADGSEYRGDDGLSVRELREWHRPRLEALASAAPDVLALETIPSLAEAEALLAEVADLGMPAWLSMTAAGGRTRRGEPLAEAFAAAAETPNIVAVGANCCDPRDLPEVSRAVRGLGAASGAGRERPGSTTTIAPSLGPRTRRSTQPPYLLFYPNSGETWDAAGRTWHGRPRIDAAAARTWIAGGARLVGGCCRVTLDLVREIASAAR